ncbi:hypothetical protein KTD19_30605 [Burkholderia multivorans]|uniref:hypothetical protein n=1 Tax=Burkholderia cepacia complex TaxID=87882 RepID=UPI000A91DABE|nr:MULTISPECIES: hypothetical protein [Burkholderia cepacia complex]MBH9645072.1 hypothetical protein [Burkholderia vietnamiensis]MBU9147403.1 hypothetical protein [Burkholderia multivorans]MBU9236721.1 hypothetical protein [Burkholderia multivorans]MBU9525028.1 hypothetical protein [Burkholderia multivorans]MBU9537025.1 hypothetical protein [Burkholderia multivorans]
MENREYLAYLEAKETLKALIAGQAIKLPSQSGAYSDPGATDAQYIKDLVTALAEFYKNIPNT